MKKSRFTSLIVVLVLIGSMAFSLQAFISSPGIPAGSLPGALAQVSGPPESELGGLLFTGLSKQNCYSMAYHAASDCDRLASGPVSIRAISVVENGPTLQNCYSEAYPAASDCDRLAFIPPLEKNVHGPTLQTCFSKAYPAGSDCDRLASARD